MTQRLADLRNDIATMEEAKQVFDDVAYLTIKLAAQDAALEKRIAKIKTDHESETADDRALMADGGAILARFIEQHKDLFQDPRKVKTSLGSFGLQTVCELAIDNPEALEKFLVKAKLEDCFELAFRLVKIAIRKRLEAGEKIPGARLNQGDTAVYKVEKTLVDQARQTGVVGIKQQ
jgi:hypothetical protein